MSSEVKDGLPVLAFERAEDFEAWLAQHVEGPGLWLKIAKKGTGVASVTQPEALDICLCYGWIDAIRLPYDEIFYLQRYVPRRKASLWSKVNVAKVEALTAAGRMKPSGLAEVEAAKADGRWAAAYDSGRTMTMPEDFAAALEVNPKAKAFYATLNKTNTYAVLWRIQTAKKPETRAARMERLIAMLNAGEKLH